MVTFIADEWLFKTEPGLSVNLDFLEIKITTDY